MNITLNTESFTCTDKQQYGDMKIYRNVFSVKPDDVIIHIIIKNSLPDYCRILLQAVQLLKAEGISLKTIINGPLTIQNDIRCILEEDRIDSENLYLITDITTEEIAYDTEMIISSEFEDSVLFPEDGKIIDLTVNTLEQEIRRRIGVGQ